MARAGLNKFHVQQARDALRARGINPSVDAVRIELGNTGSKTTIHRYLKELDQEEAVRLDDEALLSNTLKEMVGRIAARLREEAAQLIADAESRFLAEKAQLSQQLTTSQTSLAAADLAKSQCEQRLSAEIVSHQATQELLNLTRIKAERLEQQVADLTTQLTTQQQHVASLEQKHQHAREALEHFRTASKEQREQEHRRHEHQVQQLQAEQRQMNQTLSIKQSDVTQLNKDNARLLTELSEIRKQLRSCENQLEVLTSEKKNLTRDLLINSSKLIEFELDCTKDKQLISELQTQLKQLESSSISMQLELVTTKTELTVKNQLFDSLSQHLRAQ